MYELQKNVTVPSDVRDGVNGKTKYPFAAMTPIDERTGKGDCLQIDGEREVNKVLVRMRGYARDHGVKFLHQKIKRNGKLMSVRIWRLS